MTLTDDAAQFDADDSVAAAAARLETERKQHQATPPSPRDRHPRARDRAADAGLRRRADPMTFYMFPRNPKEPPMYNPREILNREPAAVSAVVLALLNVAVLLGWLNLDAEQLGAINTATALLLGLFVRQSVTPNAKI